MEASEITGFQTAGKKKPITVSAASLTNAKRKLEYDSFDEEDILISQPSMKKKVPLDKNEEDFEPLTTSEQNSSFISCGGNLNFSGFSTASNKPIRVDAEAMKKARERLGIDTLDEDVENYTQSFKHSPGKSNVQPFNSPFSNASTPVTAAQPSALICGSNSISKSLVAPRKGFVSPVNKTLSSTICPSQKNSPKNPLTSNVTKKRFSAPFRAPPIIKNTDISPQDIASPRIAEMKREEVSLILKESTGCQHSLDLKYEDVKSGSEEASVTPSRPLLLEFSDIEQYAQTKIDVEGAINCVRAKTSKCPLSFELGDDWENTVRCDVYTKREKELIARLRLGISVRIKGVFVKKVQNQISLVVNDSSIIIFNDEQTSSVSTPITSKREDL